MGETWPSASTRTVGRSVWMVAVFGKGAPPALRTVSASEVPWIPTDDEEDGGGGEEDQDKE